MKGLRLALALAAWYAFGCGGTPPTPHEVREAASCAVLAADLTERLRAGQDCSQARDEALATIRGCPLPVHCPGDE